MGLLRLLRRALSSTVARSSYRHRMTNHQSSPAQRVAGRWNEEVDDVEQLRCLITGCELEAVNTVRMHHSSGDVVHLCRYHTHRQHVLLVGPGPL